MAKRSSRSRKTDPDPRWRSSLVPAPGDLRIVQDFVNTAARDRHDEALSSPRALAEWLERWGLLDPAAELGEAELERVREVRAGLRSLIAAWPGGRVPEDVIADLNRAGAAAILASRFEAAGGVARLVPAISGFDCALARLFEIVVTTQASGLWERFSLCGRKDCRAAFYDVSARRNGRWCEPRCGNLLAARAYRRRQLRN